MSWKSAFVFCVISIAVVTVYGLTSDTCAQYCGSNNNCASVHYCGIGCNSDSDCDQSPNKTGSCSVCDVGGRTCRVPRPPAPCSTSQFTAVPQTQIMEDYASFNGLPDLATCLSKCCPSDFCSAVTWVQATWGTLCYLHNHTDKRMVNNQTTVYLRNDQPYPPDDDTMCPRCDLMDGQCSKGYGCGCPCSTDTDCDNHGVVACSKCVGRNDTSLGLCGGGPAAPAEMCVPPYPGQPHKNCSDMMDLIFLLDGSGSITPPDWILIKQFTMNIGLNFSSAPALMQYGIVQFADYASTFLHLTPSNSSFQLVMNTMWKFDTSTNTGQGLQYVADEFNTNGRPGAYKVVVLITDGMWNTGPDPIPIAKALQGNGTHIYGVAVGGADVHNVQALCSLPLTNYYFNISTESQLPIILHEIIDNMCWRDSVTMP
eukprot:PhF_6_TR35774/c0_g1_i1/m.51985